MKLGIRKMKRIVELELWSQPKTLTTSINGKAVAESCRLATLLAPEVVLGLNFIPDEFDIAKLGASLAENSALMSELEIFCHEQGLPTDPGNAQTAARFLAFIEGQPLAWLHFPAEETALPMALSVCRWAANSGYVVCREQGAPALTEKEIQALWTK